MGDRVGQRKGVGIGTGAVSSALRDTVARPVSGGSGVGGVSEDIRTSSVPVSGVAASVGSEAPTNGGGRIGIRVGSAAGMGAGVIVGKGVTTNRRTKRSGAGVTTGLGGGESVRVGVPTCLGVGKGEGVGVPVGVGVGEGVGVGVMVGVPVGVGVGVGVSVGVGVGVGVLDGRGRRCRVSPLVWASGMELQSGLKWAWVLA